MKTKMGNITAVGGHFYATSVAEWQTGECLEDLLRHMKRSGFEFSLWFIPLPADAAYEIRCFVPQVDGAVCIGRTNN